MARMAPGIHRLRRYCHASWTKTTSSPRARSPDRGLPDTSTFTTREVVSRLVKRSACDYGSRVRSIRSVSARPFRWGARNPQDQSNSSSSTSANVSLLPSLQLHTRKVAGSTPAGTTAVHARNSGTKNIGFFNSGTGNIGMLNTGTNDVNMSSLNNFGFGDSGAFNNGFGNSALGNTI
jgi:hypothetical protein